MKIAVGFMAALQIAVLSKASLKAAPGEQLWKINVGESICPPTVVSGRVFVGSLQHFRALNATNGQELWSTNMFVGHAAIAVDSAKRTDGIVEETAYVCSFTDGIQAFDVQTGTNRWKIPMTSDQPPAISRLGVIYVSTDLGVFALRKSDGTIAWTWPKPPDAAVLFAPSIGVDETIYFGSIPKTLYALDGRTGAFRWSFLADSFIVASPSIGADGAVYVGSYDHNFYALNGTTGEKLWDFETGDRIVSSAAVGPEGNVYFGSNDKQIYALDGKTGLKIWNFPTEGIVGSSPSLTADGALYFGSYDHRLYALNAATGSKLWDFLSGGEIDTAPVVGPDGAIYFTSRDMFLYALAGSAPLAASPWPSYRFDSNQSGRSAASDRPIIKNSAFQNADKFSFMVRNPAGKPFAIQSSTNLLNWTHETAFPDDTLESLFADPAKTLDKKFYRLINP